MSFKTLALEHDIMPHTNLTRQLAEALESARDTIVGLSALLSAVTGGSKSLMAETAVERINAALTQYRTAPGLDEAGDDTEDAEIVLALREAAKDATGGNCAFADDDAYLLSRLAKGAIEAGLTDGLSKTVLDSIDRKYGLGKWAGVPEASRGEGA